MLCKLGKRFSAHVRNMELFTLLLPEILLTAAAVVLFMLGVVKSPLARRLAPWVALGGLAFSLIVAIAQAGEFQQRLDFSGSVLASSFSDFVKVLTAAIGIFFILLSWPTNEDATGNTALRFGADSGEYFGLILLSFAGIMLVGGANDTIFLFMGIELASIPTYVLVSMSRPLPAAQEAGVKYFYLGAMSAAVMLLGFAYLYGATGTTKLIEMGQVFAGGREGLGYTSPGDSVLRPATWQILGAVFVLLGFAFKLAAFPLHFYAGDVYTGAATPVTALLSFVPKAVGIVATIKILLVVGGNGFALPGSVWKVLYVIAVLTMFVGNTLALRADNLKRVMAYSSIAHSGYMLVALTVLAAGAALRPISSGNDSLLFSGGEWGRQAISGVLFYLVAYGIMNAGVFAVLMMLPSRRYITDFEGKVRRFPATSAETYADIAGAGRRHPWLAVTMSVCCISLIGIPLTAGFLGKLYILWPAVTLAGDSGLSASGRTAMWWLVGLTVLNAAIGAAYYLRIIAAMVLSPSAEEEDAQIEGRAYEPAPVPRQPWPFIAAAALSVAGVLVLGIWPYAINRLNDRADGAADAVVLSGQVHHPAATPEADHSPLHP